jgi:hypothetical protein
LRLLQDYLSRFSLEDLEAIRAILVKYSPGGEGVAESGELRALGA